MADNELKLYTHITGSPEARDELAGAATDEQRSEIALRISREMNLPVSTEAVEAFLNSPSRKLSDQELEHVVGGKELHGGDGDDNMEGGDGDDTMEGEFGNDIMHGDAGNDTMYGGIGHDEMHGGEGDDYMDGGSGSDTMDGGDGNDIMDGGTGDDTLIGGEGSDVFVFGQSDGTDTIKDFNPAKDKLDFENASKEDLKVSSQDGNTYITYGDTTVILNDVEMTADEVWACRYTD